MILYHGSKGGIIGPVRPTSRARTDFGQGFYMGTNKGQAWDVCSRHSNPVYYEVSFNMDGLRVLELQGVAWLLFVLYNRESACIPDMSVLKYSCGVVKEEYDVVYGDIADDSLSKAVQDFYNGYTTMQTCFKALTMYGIGKQYAAISERACTQVSLHRVDGVSEEVVKAIRPNVSIRDKAYAELRTRSLGTPGTVFRDLIKEVSYCVITEGRLNSLQCLE